MAVPWLVLPDSRRREFFEALPLKDHIREVTP
jgi:hypothetical protein